MARVPYSPVPTAQPQSPGEGIAVNTPGAAIGENIGAALRQLGTTTEQAGGELFQRAIALQDLRNETDAREAQTNFAIESSKLHAQYSALEGKAAADGLQPYLDSQRQLRQGIRNSLNTPNAQRMFDQDSLPFLQRNAFSAAGHAADENKKYIVGTAQASIDLSAKTFVNPEDPKEFDAKVANVNRDADTVASAHNWEPGGPQEQDYKFKTVSNLWLGRVVQLAQRDPQAAIQMLRENKEQMSEQDYLKADEITLSRNRAVGTSVIANQVYSPDKTYPQMLKEGQGIIQASKADNGDPLFEPDFEKALRAKAFADRYATSQDIQSKSNDIHSGIVAGVENMQQLLAKPGMQVAYDALPPKIQQEVPGWINSYNHAKTEAIREQGDKTLTRLRGLKSDNVEEFLNATTNVMGIQGLTQPQIRQVMGWRDQLLKNPQDDPRVLRAVGWMRGAHGAELEALGITRRTENNKDEYDHYVGALEGAIEAWMADNKRPPSYEEVVDKIGPQLIKSVTTPGTVFGNVWPNTTQFYDTLDTQVQAAKAEAVKRGVEPPTDNEIRKAYLATMFQKLYGGSGGGTQPTPPGP